MVSFVIIAMDYDNSRINHVVDVTVTPKEALELIKDKPKHERHHWRYYQVQCFNGGYCDTFTVHFREDYEKSVALSKISIAKGDVYIINENDIMREGRQIQ